MKHTVFRRTCHVIKAGIAVHSATNEPNSHCLDLQRSSHLMKSRHLNTKLNGVI